MRRLLFALAALIALPFARATALPGPYRYQGCDPGRSCQFVQFTFLRETPAKYEVQMSGISTWLKRGGFITGSGGWSWDTDPSILDYGGGGGADARHASFNCAIVAPFFDPHYPAGCPVGTVDRWSQFSFLVDKGWDPLILDLHLIYQDAPGEEITQSNLRLYATPEPSSVALTALGLFGALGFARRRRVR